MGYWNHRMVVRKDHPPGTEVWTIHEISYDDADVIWGWIAATPLGTDEADLRGDLDLISQALDHPPLRYEDLTGNS
jgi:hypothetical protein